MQQQKDYCEHWYEDDSIHPAVAPTEQEASPLRSETVKVSNGWAPGSDEITVQLHKGAGVSAVELMHSELMNRGLACMQLARGMDRVSIITNTKKATQEYALIIGQ